MLSDAGGNEALGSFGRRLGDSARGKTRYEKVGEGRDFRENRTHNSAATD